jgi:hypothetical protein
MRATDYLFPAVRGGMRSLYCLEKPVATVRKSIGLPFARLNSHPQILSSGRRVPKPAFTKGGRSRATPYFLPVL